jgi:hypothetical protein
MEYDQIRLKVLDTQIDFERYGYKQVINFNIPIIEEWFFKTDFSYDWNFLFFPADSIRIRIKRLQVNGKVSLKT